MRRIGKLACSLLIFIPVAAFAGCSSSGNAGGASGPPPEEATIVVDAVPTADAAGLYIALDRGTSPSKG